MHASRGLLATIQEPQDGDFVQEKEIYNSLALLRFYVHRVLKAEYIMIENPRELWNALEERYEQQKELIWPEANHEWNHLGLQDFKSVADYNHVVHKFFSKLKFCKKEPMDADKIEKTLSTIVSSNRVLQHNTGLKILRFIPSLFIHCLKQKNMMNFF